MLKIYNLKDKLKYIKEVAELTQKEWGKKDITDKEFEQKVRKKISKIKSSINQFNYCKLILLDNETLVGFISIFPNDAKERPELSPWYATMYIKEKYRGKGYSKILNDAIIAEARKRNIKKLYLKTDLKNYYEKLGAKYLEDLNNKEKIYYFEIQTNRIAIIGGSGSGKSTLTKILSKELDIPAVHLDAINYKADWVEINKKERDEKILSKANEEKWIIDGNYNKTLKNRLDKADTIIWLDYSTFTHLKGITKRAIKMYKKDREEIPGCKERINLEFIKYVVTYNRKKRPEVINILKGVSEDKLLVFRKQRDLNKWIKKFTHNEKILKNNI